MVGLLTQDGVTGIVLDTRKHLSHFEPEFRKISVHYAVRASPRCLAIALAGPTTQPRFSAATGSTVPAVPTHCVFDCFHGDWPIDWCGC